MRYVLATALAASAALCSHPAQARDPRYRIDIRAGDAADALATLSAQTGISVAAEIPLPRRAVGAIRGEMTAGDALDRMLRALDLRAVRVGPRTYRIVSRERAVERAAVAEPSPLIAEDIVVTGRKQSEMLSAMPAPVAVYEPESEGRSGIATTTRDVARGTEGLILTNSGSGSDRPFIRGIADSPFNGLSQATVSIQLDEARLTYNAPEPGLRLIDIARVEVLKGPQGPLYGTGALGGVYRIVTNRPVLGLTEGKTSLGVSSVAGGGFGAQVEGVINLPLISDRVAVRIAGYAATDPGWIDSPKFGRDLNRSNIWGGRVAVRAAPFDGWTVDLSALTQTIDTGDSQYVNRTGTRTRDARIREPRYGKIEVFQNVIAGSIGSLRLMIATGLTRQKLAETYDASASAVVLPLPLPGTYYDWRRYLVLDQEIRLASAPGSSFTWVTGASFMLARTDADGPLLSGNGPLKGVLSAHRRILETAIFADGSFPLSTKLRLGMGFRGFHTDTRDERFAPDSQEALAESSISVTPSASLSYEIAPGQPVYVRFGTAFRPGGLDRSAPGARRYVADEVRNIDLGGRVRLDGGRLSLDGSLFRASWKDIQSDYLGADGLIATHNVGRASIIGAELSADWRLSGAWRLRAGATWQRPRLTHDMSGSALPQNVRLPVVPDISARIGLAHDIDLGGWHVTPDLSANLVGATRLSLDPDLDRRTPAYVVGRFGASAARDRLTLWIKIDNLLDASADTFSLGNPFSIRSTRQYTPLRPRTVSLSASRRF